MNIILLIINILTSITSILPKVVEYVTTLIDLYQDGIKVVADGVTAGTHTEEQLGDIKAETREKVITATLDNFSESPSAIPEPLVRIIYEYVVLTKFNSMKYHKKIKRAISKNYINGKVPDEINEAIKTYPQLFGYKP